MNMLESLTPMVKKILIANVAVFVFGMLMPSNLIENLFSYHDIAINANHQFELNPNFKPWQIFTYMFLHGGIGHIFSNMLGLFFFGPALEYFMGGNKFLRYYILCGLGAALFESGVDYYQMLQYTDNAQAIALFAQKSMVGASGAIFGILAAFAVIYPNVEMQLLFIPFPMKAKYFVTLYGLYEIVSGFRGFEPGVAHWAHIGGLITGLILLFFFGFRNRDLR